VLVQEDLELSLGWLINDVLGERPRKQRHPRSIP